MIIEKFKENIENFKLLKKGDTVICAVSGGADSVCLFHLLLKIKKEYNLNLLCANVNHHIRGKESDEDSEFVRNLCDEYNVKIYFREYDIPLLAKKMRIGEEECGRIKRYEFFNEIAREFKEAKIAVAHNLEDNAETVLFRLCRGSSSEGISGIKIKRDNIIRPLLNISRKEIVDFLESRNITWKEDSTNFETDYARNKIRLRVIPELEKISSGAVKKIVNASNLIAEDNNFLNAMSLKIFLNNYKDNVFYYFCLENEAMPIKRRIVALLLKEWKVKEITSDKIQGFLDFIKKDTGSKFNLNKKSYILKSYDRLIYNYYSINVDFCYKATENSTVEDKNWKIMIKTVDKCPKKTDNNIAVFDYNKIPKSYIIRNRKPGDKILLQGKGGTKKVSDIFSDAKILQSERDIIPVLSADNDILFISGLRQSGKYNIDSDTTKFLVVEYKNKKMDIKE